MRISKNKRCQNCRNTSEKRRAAKERELNEKFLRNFSTHQLSDDQVNVLSRGLTFIPTPVTNKTIIRQQLSLDFKQFTRRMHLQYIFHGQNKEPLPFHFLLKFSGFIFAQYKSIKLLLLLLLFMSNRFGCLQFNNPLPLKAI